MINFTITDNLNLTIIEWNTLPHTAYKIVPFTARQYNNNNNTTIC